MSQQYSWGSSSQRRGVTPISTAFNASSTNRSSNPSNSPSRNTFSPVGSNQPSQPSTARQNISRTSSVSSISSPFSPSQGAQQQSGNQLLSSARGRTIPSSSSSQLASSVAAAASQGGVGSSSGGGGPTRLSRASPSLSQSSDIGSPLNTFNPTSAPVSDSKGVASIDIAQVSILLARIDKEKDAVKRESLSKELVEVTSHGMEVFSYTFRKLLKQHASRIFGSDTSTDPAGSYNSLVNEVQKIRQDPEQAKKIAEAIDTTDGDLFRDFDVSTFMERFKLDPVSKSMLALALKNSSKSDLKTKADAILSNNLQHLLMTILNPSSETGDDLPPSYLTSLLDRLLQNPPRNWNEETHSNLNFAIRARYEKMGRPVPSEVLSTLQLAELVGPGNNLVRLVQRTGERATASLESCKEMLASAQTRDINYTQVASVLLFMAITQNGQAYNPSIFVAALRDHSAGKRLDWQDVVHAFDREGLTISKQQFLALYHALLPLAQEYENFDIQLLWGGSWSQLDTQLSFVVAFLSCTSDELDAAEVPRLRKAFTLEEFDDAPDDVKEYAARAVRHPLVSLDATSAIFNMIFQTQDTYKHAINLGIPEAVINRHTDYFVVAMAAVPQPWGGLQDQAFKQLFVPFLQKTVAHSSFVFHGLWKRDSNWLATKLIEAYTMDPTNLTFIYDHAVEHGWLAPLTGIHNEFGVDLAALAHSRGGFDLEAWLQQAYSAIPGIFPGALANFIEEKARTDIQIQKDSSLQTPSVTLSVGTVYTFVTFLQQYLPDETLTALHRICLQAYPRLINYGEGFDEIIETNSKDGNGMSVDADAAMQEHFKRLYNRDSDVRELVEALRKYKTSEVPADQELFACMIAGLFDEYNCFAEYPPDALATTAVLFGSIINFNLLSSIALQAGLSMVLEALQTATSREDKMYKFGLQALMNFQSRLAEWPTFCERLLGLPDLTGTEIYNLADDVVRKKLGADLNGEAPNGLPNGTVDDTAGAESSAPFVSLSFDPPLRPELYEDPDEDIQDKVVFAVNNLSDRNLEEKFKDLREAVTDKYHQWFAAHLVEDRAKSQPNYHLLFLSLLRKFNNHMLWEEVIRETVVSVVRMLNADATMTSTSERVHLKNLGGWLGSLTLARDKPIRHKNIAFSDLLIEANKTKRLVAVIPFTCKVLAAAKDSKTFKPPNPWIMDLLSLLLEFYHHVEMKINLKFEIEVLCKALEVDMKSIEPSVLIRESEFSFEDQFLPEVPELGGFTDLSLARINGHGIRGTLGDRFSPTAVANSLPDISTRLYYPTTSSNQVTAEQTRQVFLQAAQNAIQEIIYPVVERSVTIAGISASQLVTKDFATEPDENQFRNAAHSMVKALAGSLALVTCREPLRMSMSNNVRALSRNLPGDGLPEGVILMFVNDNIDTVCKVVEEAAEKQSVAVIEDTIREGIQIRAVHKMQQPDDHFEYPTVHRYANFMPDPFKPSTGPEGLRPEQLAIYENFGPSRPIPSHGANASQDARQQLPDLPAFDSAVPSLPTPAEAPAIPRQGVQQARVPPLGLTGAAGQANGYGEPAGVEELVGEVFICAKNAPEENAKELSPTAPVRDAYDRLIRELASLHGPARDRVAEVAAQEVTRIVFTQAEDRLEVEVMVRLLADLTQLSAVAAQRLWQWFHNFEDERFLNPRITIALLKNQLVALNRIDLILAKALRQRNPTAIEFLADLMDAVLLGEYPIALRADFAQAIEALSYWVAEEPDLEIGKQLLGRLRASSNADSTLTPPVSKQDQLEHIFDEWIHFVRADVAGKMFVAFVRQLHEQDILKDSESSAAFLRTCVDVSIAMYEQEEQSPFGSLENAYMPVDALAQLVVSLVVYQGEPDGAVKPTRPAYLDSLLSLIALIQNRHFRDRGEDANQKVFFRLYSGILCGLQGAGAALADVHDEIMVVFGKLCLALQPRYFPAFSFSWLALVSHRIFMASMLRIGGPQSGWDIYLRLMEIVLAYTGELVDPREVLPQANKVFYRAVLRIVLILHHDFQEFLVENHLRLSNSIPSYCPHLRNLIVSAFPSSMVELPDPYTQGFKVDRLEDIRRNPTIREDPAHWLQSARIRDVVDELLQTPSQKPEDIDFISSILASQDDNGALVQYMVVYIGTKAISTAEAQGPAFKRDAPHTKLLHALAQTLSDKARYFFMSAIVNQLRYPNSHTHFFSYALLDIFGYASDYPPGDAVHLKVQESIARVLLERLVIFRPHPWGLLITIMELYKNPQYEFFGLPFVKASEDVWNLPSLQAVRNGAPYGLS